MDSNRNVEIVNIEPAHRPGQVPGQPTRVRLTPEEIKVLRECNRESFYYRCLPYSTLAMTLTHMAVKAGYLRPNPRWGSMFKVLGAGLAGFIIGKFSYQKKCIEKIMQLPNSNLGEALRKRQKGASSETIEIDTTEIFTPSKPTEDSSSRFDTADRVGVDVDKNIIYEGLDDNLRPTIDSTTRPSEESTKSVEQKYATYDEMREKNRAEYEAKRRELYQKRAPPPPTRSSASQTSPPAPGDEPQGGVKPVKQSKGKYGDVWDE